MDGRLPSRVPVLAVTAAVVCGLLLGGCRPATRVHALSDLRASVSIPVADPFGGSPAERYASGADGIVLPTVTGPVGRFPAEQVRRWLAVVKQALVAMYLDPAVWRGARPARLLDLADPVQAPMIDSAFDRPTATADPGRYATRFAPGEAEVYGTTVKVHGTVTLSAVRPGGPLRVHTDHLFVYVVRSLGDGRAANPSLPPDAAELARVVLRRTIDFDFYDPARFWVVPDRFLLARIGWSAAGVECGWTDGFLHPAFGGTPRPAREPSTDPYDLGRSGPGRETCTVAARV